MSYSTISNTLVVEISFYSIMKDILVRKSKFWERVQIFSRKLVLITTTNICVVFSYSLSQTKFP